MKIHEYQARELLLRYGIPVPNGIVIASAEEAADAAETFGKCVLKAQVHSGGRGKAGGVRLAESPGHAGELAGQMLGMKLVTRQTGPEGRIVRKLLVTEAMEIRKEYYLSVTGDSRRGGLMIVASASGGTEIEELAREHPEQIVQVPVSVTEGFRHYEGLTVIQALSIPERHHKTVLSMLDSLVRLYLEQDCSLVEINPLAETEDGRLLCLDAKINFDDNALFRHPDILALRDTDEEDPLEYQASLSGLSYIHLGGSIGCMVNGAGLAMATTDIIRKFGGMPANFLDVGGSATVERVSAAFHILLSDPNVRSIFINIFGGIMKCDVIAEGIVSAIQPDLAVPVIVRLEGTNVELGRRILAASAFPFIPATDMADGARKAVAAAEEGKQ